jgi:hypothetical protein
VDPARVDGLLPPRNRIRGFVYDVKTGRLNEVATEPATVR